jgi:hypothetical protein
MRKERMSNGYGADKIERAHTVKPQAGPNCYQRVPSLCKYEIIDSFLIVLEVWDVGKFLSHKSLCLQTTP